jgi:hypothetical protein
MLKVYKKSDDDSIFQLKTADSRFSYSYLIKPRTEDNFGAGTYGTELIIKDKATIKAIKQYLDEVVRAAIPNVWNNKLPKSIHMPFREGDADNELEAGAYVLKTASKIQPKIFIRLDGESKAHEVEEDELDDIYAGMIGEAVFAFSAYNYNGACGIKAYLNAVCKTGDGEPLAARVDYESEFSLSSEFDDDEDEKDEEEDIKEEVVKAPSKTKKSTKKVEDEEDEEEVNVDLDSLIKTKKNKQTPTGSSKGSSKKPTNNSYSIEDLL